MWDTIQKLEQLAGAGICRGAAELETRLSDRLELPLSGIHGERLYLTGVKLLRQRAAELEALCEKLPPNRGAVDTIVLDAWSSATIEGARTTVDNVLRCMDNPQTRDDRMVINTVRGYHYAYDRPITEENLRSLWELVVDGVCENEGCRGTLYREAMVYVGSGDRVIHTPAPPEQLPGRMKEWFRYSQAGEDLLLRSFISHFCFVYLHPFCDGNGRTARILNASQLYHGGYRQMKTLPLVSAINNRLSGYYRSLSDSEKVLNTTQPRWLDLSPFVSFMLDAFEGCLVDAVLSGDALSSAEGKLLERMNRRGSGAEITVQKAGEMLKLEESDTRNLLNGLVRKGYLTVNTAGKEPVYRLEQHLPVVSQPGQTGD